MHTYSGSLAVSTISPSPPTLSRRSSSPNIWGRERKKDCINPQLPHRCYGVSGSQHFDLRYPLFRANLLHRSYVERGVNQSGISSNSLRVSVPFALQVRVRNVIRYLGNTVLGVYSGRQRGCWLISSFSGFPDLAADQNRAER